MASEQAQGGATAGAPGKGEMLLAGTQSEVDAPRAQEQSRPMTSPAADRVFSGSVADVYDRYLVPLIFEPYAQHIASRVAKRDPRRVLEVAAGTGVATRALALALPSRTVIVATDLNQPMLDRALAVGTERPVEFRQADAQQLPFEDRAFDVVVCQFGVMFFPGKQLAFAEARRVLAPGGALLFSVWDRIEENEFADEVTAALADQFPEAPPAFLARTPHGYHQPDVIARDLGRGGFQERMAFETLTSRSRAASPEIPAIAYCLGTPLRDEIEARGAGSLARATRACADAIAGRFGSETVEGKIQACVIAADA